MRPAYPGPAFNVAGIGAGFEAISGPVGTAYLRPSLSS